jgi:aminopeptidase-like protein
MGLLKEFDQNNLAKAGQDLHRLASRLFPICRSITGDGIRKTLALIGNRIPLRNFEVPTGTQVFDWTVPKEWNIRDAYIKAPDGTRVVDFQKSCLHVLNYSTPVHAKMRLSDLKAHLFTIPEKPDGVPYRTSYYQENWGFCLSHNQMLALVDGEYEVCIDSSLEDGRLTYAECYLPGRSTDEVLISTHACHPSLANDNLSGVVVATFLAEFLAKRDLRYSYRFLFLPGTIGAITWLARNAEAVSRIRHGLVLAALGNDCEFHYKKSRRGDTEIDRAAALALRDATDAAQILEFSPYGFDERQYCSPGFNLPVGCLTRPADGFPENHTSADNLDFTPPEKLAEALRVCVSIMDILENNHRFLNLSPHCEPQLGKRGLYRPTGGVSIEKEINARLWVLNQSDGDRSLLEIAERSGLDFQTISDAAEMLRSHSLLSIVSGDTEVTTKLREASRVGP